MVLESHMILREDCIQEKLKIRRKEGWVIKLEGKERNVKGNFLYVIGYGISGLDLWYYRKRF